MASLTDNLTILWYFFSALAQCAAAFAGLVAVFAVFRFQAIKSEIQENYRAARYWLRIETGQGYSEQKLREQPDKEIQKLLEEIRDRTVTHPYTPMLKQSLESLQRSERLSGELAWKVSVPLRLWADIFVFSLIALVLSRFDVRWAWAGFLAIAFSVCLVLYTLWRSKRFIQDCLKFD